MEDRRDHHPGEGLAEPVVWVPGGELPLRHARRPVLMQGVVDPQDVARDENTAAEDGAVKNADRSRDRPDDQRNATRETFAHRPLRAASKNCEGCKVEDVL